MNRRVSLGIAGGATWLLLLAQIFWPRTVVVRVTDMNPATSSDWDMFVISCIGLAACLGCVFHGPEKRLGMALNAIVMSAIIPAVFFVLEGAVVVYVLFRFGHLPIGGQQDPGTVGIGLVEFGVLWGMLVGGLLLGYVRRAEATCLGLSMRSSIAILSSLSTWAAFWVSMRYDWLGFMRWISD